MALPTQWTWVWVRSGIWRWTGKPGVLQSMGSQKSLTRLNDWTKLKNRHGLLRGFPGGPDGKVSAWDAGDSSLIPGLGRSPGEGNGNPLQYSCLENSTDGGAWWATVHGVAKSRTGLSDFTLLSWRLNSKKAD